MLWRSFSTVTGHAQVSPYASLSRVRVISAPVYTLLPSSFLAVSYVRDARMAFPDLDYVYFALIRNTVYAQSEITILVGYSQPSL